MVDATIVIAHCYEDLSWTSQLNYPFEIYSMHSIREGTLCNIGREANAYLRYIINNYNNLSEYTIFLHGHDTTWHQSEHIYDTIKKLKFNKKYYNINVNNRELVELMCTPYMIRFVNNRILNNLIFNRLGIKFDYTKTLEYRSKHNAQFYVHKDLITQYNINQWKDLYNTLYTYNKYNISSCDLGIVYECLWFFIFTQQYVDIKTEN